MDILISVIVPVYNVELYIDECVQSILNQTYRSLEVILIDDGSTDTSDEKCEKYIQQDDRVRVIHQGNRGLSAARNAGIDICIGEWIIFVDSDDVLPNDAIENLLSVVVQQKAEIGQGVLSTVQVHPEAAYNPVIEIYEGKDFLKSSYFSTTACGKIYHRTIWNHRRFREGIIHEDYDIMYRIIYETSRVAFANYIVYNVRNRSGSITRSGYSDKKLILLDIDEEKIAYFKEKGDNILLDQAYMSYYGDLLYLYKQNLQKNIIKKYRKNIKNFLRIKTIRFRTKVKLIVCYLFPRIW